MDEKCLRVEELASILGLSALTVYRRCKDGTIRSARIGRSIRIPASEVKRLTGRRASKERGQVIAE